MADNNLAQMGDMELLKLFSINGQQATPRARQVRAELERRGYHYDPVQKSYVTCQKWNELFPNARKDCAEEARQRRSAG